MTHPVSEASSLVLIEESKKPPSHLVKIQVQVYQVYQRWKNCEKPEYVDNFYYFKVVLRVETEIDIDAAKQCEPSKQQNQVQDACISDLPAKLSYAFHYFPWVLPLLIQLYFDVHHLEGEYHIDSEQGLLEKEDEPNVYLSFDVGVSLLSPHFNDHLGESQNKC